MGAPDTSDPFAIFHTPPPNETPGERAAREQREIEARKVSERIDEELKQEKARLKREKFVRVLLLGQSESGKSTTLKNFRYHYARSAWDAERSAWRAVIQLNVVRSVLSVLDAVQAQVDGVSVSVDNEDGAPTPTVTSFNGNTASTDDDEPSTSQATNDPISVVRRTASTQSIRRVSSFRHPLASPAPQTPGLSIKGFSAQQVETLAETYTSLKAKLECLHTVEGILMRRLGEGSTEDYGSPSGSRGVLGEDDDGQGGTTPEDQPRGRRDGGGQSGPTSRASTPGGGIKREWGVQRLQDALLRSSLGPSGKAKEAARSVMASEGDDGEDEPTRVLAECKEAMQALWADEGVRAVLRKRKVRIEDKAGFFLDDLARIATPEYTPSDADVVRARLRTLGVQEYRISFDKAGLGFGAIGSDFGQEWLLYDVGGSRTMRHAWAPYFDDMQAIIFLAPVSCFDERLSEDSKVNRLEDSFLLFRKICSSKLLARTTMILFLNKCDLLKRKLRSGVKVRDYLPSFGDRKNETGTVVKYLREKFREVLKENSPEQRASYFYATSVIDTEATANTITAVRDSILQSYLKRADFV